MHTDFPILHGPYLHDLLSQPRALADTVDGLRKLNPPPVFGRIFSKIILTGMGSSLFALHPLQLQLIQAGRTALMVETAELIYGQSALIDANSLIIAVSQSGRSAETLSLLQLIREYPKPPYLIGVTNTADSPLALAADYPLLLCAGPEFSVSCKTYLATLVALDWLAGVMCGQDVHRIVGELEEASSAVETYFTERNEHVAHLIDQLREVRHVFLTGRGSSLAAVGTGALTLKESTRFHVEGMSSPAFRHGPLEMVSSRLFALVFAGDPATAHLNASLVRDIRSAGGMAALVSQESGVGVFRLPRVSRRLRPVVEMLPVQMMSLALAVLAGREPGLFERATKVTVTQ